MKTIYLFIISLFLVVECLEVDEQIGIGLDVLKYLSDNKHVSMHKTSDIRRGDGFKSFNNVIYYNKKSVYSITKEIENLKNSKIFDNVNIDIRKGLEIALDEINDNVLFKPNFIGTTFNFIYKNPSGNMTLARIYIEKIDEGYIRTITILDVSFVPANPYVILTSVNEDLFSKDVEQRIEYLPATINEEHLDFIYHINGNLLSFLEQQEHVV